MNRKLISQSKTSKKLFFAIIILLIVCGVGYIVKTRMMGDGLVRECPSEMIINNMPGADRSGESDSEDVGTAFSPSYYILNEKRREVAEFDTAWISENCQVPVTNVQ